MMLGVVVATVAMAQMPAARPDDVRGLDEIIPAFYDVISGPAGQPRQWRRDSSLYIPGVRFVAMSVRDGRPAADVGDHAAGVGRGGGGGVWPVRPGAFLRARDPSRRAPLREPRTRLQPPRVSTDRTRPGAGPR